MHARLTEEAAWTKLADGTISLSECSPVSSRDNGPAGGNQVAIPTKFIL